MNKSQYELDILKAIDAIPVQRNNGIDGFIMNKNISTPIAVRIKKENENIIEAKNKLLSATINKEFEYKVLIKINDDNLQKKMLEEKIENDIILLDTYGNILKENINKYVNIKM